MVHTRYRKWLCATVHIGDRLRPRSAPPVVRSRLQGACVKPRLNYSKVAPGVYDAMDALDQYLAGCGLEESLLHLARLRASQLNGCAYCIDMHWKDLRALGETEQRLASLDAWRECPYYTERERAVLAWTEAATFLATRPRPQSVHDQ